MRVKCYKMTSKSLQSLLWYTYRYADVLYNYFATNNLFSSCQSGFRAGDSCVSQMLSITHDIFTGFEANPPLDTRGVFLDMSKAFDRVWHEGLICKLNSYF